MKTSILFAGLYLVSLCSPAAVQVEKFGFFEWQGIGQPADNPFADTSVAGLFSNGDKEIKVRGFYDGDGVYKCRFMPNSTGKWSFVITSNDPNLDGQSGEFTCIENRENNNGPVRVVNKYHFQYADGTPYFCFGTTAYAWQHQPAAMIESTLETLAGGAFNKVRMCVFPKRFGAFINNEPNHYPYQGTAPDKWDFTRFDPQFFQHLEWSILRLQELGIEADLILFHPYDEGHWGFDSMSPKQDIAYLEYLLARLSSFRNVWWSMANEWDLLRHKSVEQWNDLIDTVSRNDPYGHLISIHNAGKLFDQSHPDITHLSLQNHSPEDAASWHDRYGKPVIFDEMGYEGDMGYNYGDLTGEQMVQRFWLALTNGGYASHGEMYDHPDNILFWSKGGTLHGTSEPRIRFMRKLIEESLSSGLMPYPTEPWWNRKNCGSENENAFFYYYEDYQPAFRPITLPEKHQYTVEVIDTWNMTIKKLPGTYSGYVEVDLPGRPYSAIRAIRTD